MRDFDIPNHDAQLDAPYEREWRDDGEDDDPHDFADRRRRTDEQFDEDCVEDDED